MRCIPNIFPEYVELETTEIINIGKCKSFIFILTFISSVCIAAIYYISEETTTQITISNPSYSEYLSIQSNRPTCECSNNNIPMNTFVTLNVENEVFCTQASNKYTRCSQDPSGLSLSEQELIQVCTESPAFSYLQGLHGLCTNLQISILSNSKISYHHHYYQQH